MPDIREISKDIFEVKRLLIKLCDLLKVSIPPELEEEWLTSKTVKS